MGAVMKALQTQFDNQRLSSAVATPTCSSCCCCCCCLATSVAASSLLAQRVGKEGEKHQIEHRHLYTVLAALFVPIVGLLVYLGFWTINSFLSSCTNRSYSDGGEIYSVCTNPGAATIWPLLFIVPMVVLWFLYSRVHIEQPVKRAAWVTALIAVAFTVELFAGAVLILTGAGGIVYLILVPLIVGWISKWYHNHLGKESAEQGAALTPAALPSVPLEQQPPKGPNYYADIPPEDEPPQQNPPTPGA
jgi:hypothetical protein